MPRPYGIRELLAQATSAATPVADLLRLARLLATERGEVDFAEWVKRELEGYPVPEPLPQYRQIRGFLRALTRHGYRPLGMEVEGRIVTESVSVAYIRQSAGEVESLVRGGSQHVVIDRPAILEELFQQKFHIPAHVDLLCSASAFAGILEFVRNRVMEWGLRMTAESPAHEFEDAEAYIERVNSLPAMADNAVAVGQEYQRFRLATSSAELTSVFRALAPTVEAVLKNLLRAHGSQKVHLSLGTVIAELRERRIGGVGFISQVAHILRFGRDLAQHGNEIPDSVLRLACENAFQLVLQAANLFPNAPLVHDEVGSPGPAADS